MTLKELHERIAAIKSAAKSGDDEVAHSRDDELRRKVLGLIARGEIGDETAREYAELALSTGSIDFARYCA